MTIGDVVTKISSRELDLWAKYRAKYGPLNPIRKYDQGNAIVAAAINNAHGGKASAKDFMPYLTKDKESDIVVDADTFMEMLGKNEKSKVVR